MTAQSKKELFYWYLDNTPLEKIKRLEYLTLDFIIRKKIGLEK